MRLCKAGGRRLDPLLLFGAVQERDLDRRRRLRAAARRGVVAAALVTAPRDEDDDRGRDREPKHDQRFAFHVASPPIVLIVSSNSPISWFMRSNSWFTSPDSASI